MKINKILCSMVILAIGIGIVGCSSKKEKKLETPELICELPNNEIIRDLAINKNEDILFIADENGNLYKSKRNKGEWSEPSKIDCNGLKLGNIYLNNKDGKLFFCYYNDFDDSSISGEIENGYYTAEEDDGKLVNISKNTEIDYQSILTIDVKDGKMIYIGNDGLSLQQCDITEGLSSIENIMKYEMNSDNMYMPCELMGDEVICRSYEFDFSVSKEEAQHAVQSNGEDIYYNLVTKYIITNLSSEIQAGLDIDNAEVVETSESGKNIYFSYDDNKVYKVSSASLRTKFNTEENNNKETEETEQKETKEYIDGERSYDEFDTSDFEFVARNKTGMDEKSGVYYEIFVRSFADSNGDGIGDFNGITEKLDYLKDLGISGIYLMPINQSASYHGYDITDYNALNSDYGTEEDFKNLIEEAHNRGIKVIMDFVINHTGSNHPWFTDAILNKDSTYRNYYRFVAENDIKDFNEMDSSPWGSLVWNQIQDGDRYYSIFNGGMPDLNYNNPAVRKEIKESAGKWLNLGVDGFRMDAAMHIYGVNEFKQQEDNAASNLQWWNEFAAYCETINPKVYLIGEIWDDDEVHSEYVQPFDTKFDFTFEQNMILAVQFGKAVLSNGKNLSELMEELIEVYNGVDQNYINGVFGTNHDQNRIMSEVDNEEQAKIVANIYLTLPGNPFLYYGEELGMKGNKPDEFIRTPFKWSKDGSENTSWETDLMNEDLVPFNEQKNDENSMYNYYKKLIALRNSNASLSKGNYNAVDTKNESIMAYVREYEGEKVMVIHNLSSAKQDINLSDYSFGEVLLSQNTGTVVNGNSIGIEKTSSLILKIK